VSCADDGLVACWDTRASAGGAKAWTAAVGGSSAVNAVAVRTVGGLHTIVAGANDGGVHVLDPRAPDRPLARMRRNDAPVTAIDCNAADDSFWVAAGDGACSLWAMPSAASSAAASSPAPGAGASGPALSAARIVCELSGVEFEPVRDVVRHPTSATPLLYTAAADGAVRAYGALPIDPSLEAAKLAVLKKEKLAMALRK
jgi:hypothetical protein